jgi:hypothetical protein
VRDDLPTERKFYEFEQATVIYNVEHVPGKDGAVPKLEVQILDQYGYQRELSFKFRVRGGQATTYYWEVHTYRHPGRRDIQHVSERVAIHFITRFLDICEKHPIFLFNSADQSGSPRSKGFVQLSERLLDGERCGVHMLD